MGWLDRLFGKKPSPAAAPPACPAFEHALARTNGQEPFRYAAHVLFADGGLNPLDAVDVYPLGVSWLDRSPGAP